MPNFSGSLPTGHVITNVQIEPAHIDVVGTEEDIAVFDGITLAPIDISGLTNTVTIRQDARDFLLSTDLSIQNSRPHEIHITITVEQEELREFNIPIENIAVTGYPLEGFLVELPDEILIRLMGVSRIIDVVGIGDFSLSVDLTDLEAGVHSVPVSLVLPEGVRRVDAQISLTVTVLDENADDGLEELETDDISGEDLLEDADYDDGDAD
jgi:YbbR domain-containing protein